MKQSLLKTRNTTSRDGVPGVITFGLQYLQGNSDSYFTLTAWYKGYNRKHQREEFGGCCHDEILAKHSDLQIFADLHFSESDGVPMHAEANGWYQLAGAMGGLGERYHAGNSDRQHWKADGSFEGYRHSTTEECLEQFAKHCRITIAEADKIRQAVAEAIGNRKSDAIGYPKDCARGRAVFAKIIQDMRPRWKTEAQAAIAILERA